MDFETIKLLGNTKLPGGALHLTGELVYVQDWIAKDLVDRGLATRPSAATHVAAPDGPPVNKQVQEPSIKKGRA